MPKGKYLIPHFAFLYAEKRKESAQIKDQAEEEERGSFFKVPSSSFSPYMHGRVSLGGR